MTQRATTGALAAALVVAVGIIGWLLSTTNSPATAILPPRTAELSGDVYMTMKSGDVKRAADIEVVIVPASAELSARWRSMLDAFAVERALLEAAIRTAQAAHDAAEKKSKIAGQIDYIAASDARLEATHAYSRLISAQLALGRFIREQQARAARALAAEAGARILRTDVNGQYKAGGLPPGHYHVYASQRAFDEEQKWLITAELKGGETRLDLSNSNTGNILRPLLSRPDISAALTVSPWPGVGVGASVTAFGVLLLAIRRPIKSS